MKQKHRFPVISISLCVLAILSGAVSRHHHSSFGRVNVPHLCDAIGESSEECATRSQKYWSPREQNQNLGNHFHANILMLKGECLPLPPPPPPPINDTDVPLQKRLADGIEILKANRLAVGAEDNAIFILGNTGSGKSTVTQLLAGNLSRIFSTKPPEGGGYVIFDEDDRIGAPTTESKTLLPEFVARRETGVIFVDAPGFDDNRGTDSDIAAMYFLKYALDSVSQAKFLFTVVYSSVQIGNDRLDFDLLVEHAVTLIPKPKLVNPSIALLVTKVSRFNDDGELRTREELLGEFKSFLNTYLDVKKRELDNASGAEQREFIQRKIDFVEILLSNLGSDQLPTRISYVRKPEDCGALSELPEMLETKKILTDLYSTLINYTTVSPDSFKVTLKDKTIVAISTKHIPDTVEQIANQTEIGCTKMRTDFLEKFHNNLTLKEVKEPTEILTQANKEIDLALENIRADGTNFAEQLFDLFSTLQMNPNDKLCITNEIQELENQLTFFESVSALNVSRPDDKWLVPLETTKVNFTDLQEFYDFCGNLETELGSYPRQVKLEWQARKPGGLEFEPEKVLSFLQEIFPSMIPSKIEKLWQSKLMKGDKDYLVGLVRSQFPGVNSTCEPLSGSYRLKVVGKKVRMSDVVNGSTTPPPAYTWPDACSNPEKVQQISIFAQERVFFDADLPFDCKRMHVSIMAPEWEAIGSSKVQLGCHQDIPPYSEDADDGETPGAPGHDGKMGQEGVGAGTFFGMLTTEINGGGLEINTDGGPAGPGQNGGKGHEGSRGERSCSKNVFPAPDDHDCGWRTCRDAKQGKVTSGDGSTKEESKDHGSSRWKWYSILGPSGGTGGSGGGGGDGGFPGKKGAVEINFGEGKQTGSFKLSSKTGSRAKGGMGGSPGQGGMGGQHCSCKWKSVQMHGGWFSKSWEDCYATTSTLKAATGEKGSDGNESPEQNDEIPLAFDPAKLINEYKSLFDSRDTRRNFSTELDTLPNFIRLQTPLSLAQELVAIETTYYRERSKTLGKDDHEKWERMQIYYINLYDNFLAKIKAYAKIAMTPPSSLRAHRHHNRVRLSSIRKELTLEEKLALNYIYVTVLSKVVALRQNLMSAVKVINTAGYFQTVEKKLAALRKAEADKAISEESSAYQDKLNARIQEANGYISDTVLPAIDSTEEALDELNKKLLVEIDEWLKKAEEYEHDLEEMKRKMEKSMPLRALFGFMKIIGVAAQFLGPIGGAAGAAIGGVAGIGSGLVIDNSKPGEKSFDLPPAFSSQLKKHSKRYYQSKIDTLSDQIKATKEVCDQVGSELGDLEKTAEDTQKTVDDFKKTVDAWTDPPEQIVKKDKEVDDAQKKLADKVEEKSKNSNTPVVKYLDTGFKLLGAGVDLFKDLVGATKDLQKMELLIADAKQKVKQIEAKKAAVYNDFIPLLEEAMEDIHAAGKSLDGQTLVGLSVKRWRIQGMLQDMQNIMTTFTSGLEVEPEFVQCVETLSRSCSLLIELYNHIERYEEKKELADYIANINSVGSPSDQIKEPQLKKAITQLQFLVQANLFLHDYQIAMSAFKQWVFPFPTKYLTSDTEEMELSKLLEMDKDQALDQTLSIYQEKVTTLSTKLQEYQSTTQHGEDLLIVSMFIGGLVSTRPFYIWSNAQWHSEIVNLLSGNTVQLRASLSFDPKTVEWFRGMTAVKYKCIRLRLRATDESQQDKLDETLKNFHMRMVHSGISEYRAVNQKYVMFDSNVTYRYSFEEVNGQSVSWNVVKEKVCVHGDYLMSPFTWWTLTILPANPSVGQAQFNELVRKFGDQVNLDLEGDGMYLDEANAEPWRLKDLKLEQFYEKLDDSNLIGFGGTPSGYCDGEGPNVRGAALTPLSPTSCPLGENWVCYDNAQKRDDDCNERQWVKIWMFRASHSLSCYCCQK